MDRHALCIGINYDGSSAQLSNCVNDARTWRGIASGEGISVTGLVEQDATKRNILGEIDQLVASLGYRDLGIITYSGHGSWDVDSSGDEPDGRDELLCPVDIFQGNYISDDELDAIFKKRRHGARLVFISDSCHSGTVTRAMTRGGGVPKSNVRYLPPSLFMPSRRLRGIPTDVIYRASPPGRHHALLLSGCKDDEYSYDGYGPGVANGAFTHIAATTYTPGETYARWNTAVRKSLPDDTAPQTPQLYGAAHMKRWKVFT
jgi:metacaspase-1